MENQISANTVILWAVLAMLVVATFVGNSFVITAILIDKNLQTNANQLVLSLAVADLMVACLVMPLGAYNEVYQGWYLGTQVCEFWTSADVLCCTASILNLLAIALDRYWAVTSVDYIYRRTRQRIIVMVICVWTFGAVVSLAPIFGWKDPKFSERVLVEHKCLVSQDVGYQIFATISTFYAPLVLLLALYWRIFQVARKRIHRKPGDRLRAAPVQEPTTKLESLTLAPNRKCGSAPAPANKVRQLRNANSTDQLNPPAVAQLPPCQLMNKSLIEATTWHVTSNRGSRRQRRPSSPLPVCLSSAPTNAQTTSQQLSPSALLLWNCAESQKASCKMNNDVHGHEKSPKRGRCCVGLNNIGSPQSCCNITCTKLCYECCCSNCGPAQRLTSSNPHSFESQLNQNSLLEPVSVSGGAVDRFYARPSVTTSAHQLLDKDLACRAPLQVSAACGPNSSPCGSISMSRISRGSGSHSSTSEKPQVPCGASFCVSQPNYENNTELEDEGGSLCGSFTHPHTSMTNPMKGQVEIQQDHQGSVWRHRLAPKRSLDIRRRFKVLGELISFLQTSKSYSSSSDDQNSPSSNQWKQDLASKVSDHHSTGVATVTDRVSALASLQVVPDEFESAPETVVDFVVELKRPDGRKCSGVLALDRHPVNKQPQVVRDAVEQSQLVLSNASQTPLHQCTSAGSQPIVVNDHPQQASDEQASRRVLPTSGQAEKSLSSQQRYTNKPTSSKQRANIDVKREKKAAKTLAIITGVFVCCWLPFFLNAIIMPICGTRCTPSDLVLSILLWLGYLNSMLNPIIYTIFSPDFRRAFRRLLCWPALGASGGASSRS